MPSASLPGPRGDRRGVPRATSGRGRRRRGSASRARCATGVAKITKLPWRLETRRLARRVADPARRAPQRLRRGGARAAASSTAAPARDARARPAEPGGPVAMLGAGTGLGQAAVVRARRRTSRSCRPRAATPISGRATPSRTGSSSSCARKFGRASRDRILSGGGLALALRVPEAGRLRAPRRRRVAAELDAGDGSAPRSSAASGCRGRDRLCRAALDLFVSIYGSEAGNLALQYRATGGVYVGGGIAPKILPALRRPGVPAGVPRRSRRWRSCSRGFRCAWCWTRGWALRRGGARAYRGRRSRRRGSSSKTIGRARDPGRSSATARRRPSCTVSIVSGPPSSSRTSSVVIPSCSARPGSVCSVIAVLASPTTRLRSELSTAALGAQQGMRDRVDEPETVGPVLVDPVADAGREGEQHEVANLASAHRRNCTASAAGAARRGRRETLRERAVGARHELLELRAAALARVRPAPTTRRRTPRRRRPRARARPSSMPRVHSSRSIARRA